MSQPSATVYRERVIAVVLGLAGFLVLTVSVAETPWSSLKPLQILLAVLLAGMVILADQYPIHLGHRTKAAMTSLPIYLGVVFLPAPLAILVGGVGMLVSNLLARTERGLLPRDFASTVGQWMFIAFIGSQINLLTIPGLDQHTERFFLLTASALAFLFLDFTIFSLSNSFILKEPFLHTFKVTFLGAIDFEGIQLLVALLGALAIDENSWALPLFAAAVITTYYTFKNIKEVKYETLRLLEDMADTVDLRDIYTGGHSRRVAELVRRTLIQLEIYGPEATLIETAARLHDIGKIGIPDDILKKPGKLSPEETAVMQTHSEQGAKLISKYRDFGRGALILRHHHESWNGHGYPSHLKGYEIPFGSRVIAVADSFDAMNSDRPYRKALSAELSIQILVEGRGKQWDPDVVDAFTAIFFNHINDSSSAGLSESQLSPALSKAI